VVAVVVDVTVVDPVVVSVEAAVVDCVDVWSPSMIKSDSICCVLDSNP